MSKRKSKLKYYDIPGNWKKIRKFVSDPGFKDILQHDLNVLLKSRCNKEFQRGGIPLYYSGTDWWCPGVQYRPENGRMPPYWKYIFYGAQHWMANSYLYLAKKVEPDKPWGIMHTLCYSVVYDGDKTLFDLQGLALQIPPADVYRWADGVELGVGEYRDVYPSMHFKEDVRRDTVWIGEMFEEIFPATILLEREKLATCLN
jgi:hypothetical protein